MMKVREIAVFEKIIELKELICDFDLVLTISIVNLILWLVVFLLSLSFGYTILNIITGFVVLLLFIMDFSCYVELFILRKELGVLEL